MDRSTMFNGKTYTMKMAMFNSYVTNHQRLHHIFESLYMVITSLYWENNNCWITWPHKIVQYPPVKEATYWSILKKIFKYLSKVNAHASQVSNWNWGCELPIVKISDTSHSPFLDLIKPMKSQLGPHHPTLKVQPLMKKNTKSNFLMNN